MVKSLEIDCDTEIDQSALYEFSRRMTDFCRRGRKPHKQIIAICDLLILEDDVRKSIPWREIDAALKFSTCQDLNQLHSKLLHRLRENCLRACFEIDPGLCRPFNQHGFIFASRQGYGVQLGCIRRYNGKGFNYSALQMRAAQQSIPIEAVGIDFLRGQADRIRRQCTSSIIQIGKSLLETKRHLSDGAFQRWIESEVGIPVRTAQVYMRAAQWAAGKSAIVAHLPASAICTLSANGVPERFIVDVLERLEAGEQIGAAAIRQELKAFVQSRNEKCAVADEADPSAQERHTAGNSAPGSPIAELASL